ncbi:MAG: FlgD immunoglobulin-like domain containing protein [Calditrichia bacterium]
MSFRFKPIKTLLVVCMLQLLLVSSNLYSQPAPIAESLKSYMWHSGVHDGADNSAITEMVYSSLVRVDGVPWIRLQFSASYLGNGSFLRVTSQLDGYQQILDARAIAQWRNSSAYFNGDALLLELFVAQEDDNVFLQIDNVVVGEWGTDPIFLSQCGPVDDRIQDTEPWSGRIMPIGCTGWIVADGKHITAGHCISSNSQVLQFNVPPSLPGGTTQNPPPEDQFPIIQSSFVGTGSGVGNDWAVFDCNPNSLTGELPIDRQGGGFILVQDHDPDSIRITGYGVDTGVDNQTLQTHIGPNAGSSGNVMRYVTDTEGGNSGSPVIDGATHFAVGVHTHGGCNTGGGGNNNGTSFFHPAFWAAVDFQPFLPEVPLNAVAYSDYTTPDAMTLTWEDPTRLVTGDMLEASEFTVMVTRDDVLVDSIAGGVETFTDTGLNDGQEYLYSIVARHDSSGFNSDPITTIWTAGGAATPDAPTALSVSGNQSEVSITWTNPATNIDNTPMDDLAGINLYQNGVLVTTFAQTSGDTAGTMTETYSPQVPAYYDWQVSAVDDEAAENESELTEAVGTPLGLPIADQFDVPGIPNPGVWENSGGEVDDRAQNAPSGPYSLNLNGRPSGEDIVDMKPVDTSGLESVGLRFNFNYQPQGTGNAPEENDTLRVMFKNDLGEWITVWSKSGSTVVPFEPVSLDITSAPNGGGTYFHGQFQVRLQANGGASSFPNDDWFVDDVELLNPLVGIGEESQIPQTFSVSQNYPNPFNPSTAISFQIPQRQDVRLVVYNSLGQQVRELLNNEMNAGQHQVKWNGMDDAGKPVASGVFVYRFNAGEFRHTGKMTLLK